MLKCGSDPPNAGHLRAMRNATLADNGILYNLDLALRINEELVLLDIS